MDLMLLDHQDVNNVMNRVLMDDHSRKNNQKLQLIEYLSPQESTQNNKTKEKTRNKYDILTRRRQ